VPPTIVGLRGDLAAARNNLSESITVSRTRRTDWRAFRFQYICKLCRCLTLGAGIAPKMPDNECTPVGVGQYKGVQGPTSPGRFISRRGCLGWWAGALASRLSSPTSTQPYTGIYNCMWPQQSCETSRFSHSSNAATNDMHSWGSGIGRLGELNIDRCSPVKLWDKLKARKEASDEKG